MFWILIFCHLIADYPLQSNAMVKAKKTLSGLFMHISVHFLTLMVILCVILNYDIGSSLYFAVSISFFHLVIDHWKNVLSRLKPKWVIFTYIQDQILHVLSILLVISLWQLPISISLLNNNYVIFVYASGFVLSSYCWFITEYVLSYKHSVYQQRLVDTMWPRMMSRAIFYSIVIVGFSYWVIPVIAGAIIVVWYDLDEKIRYQTIAKDIVGVSLLIYITRWIIY
jgi:Protein of unknown function (DUF3307)